MELAGSNQARIGFERIYYILMTREQWEQDIGDFCSGSVDHHWRTFEGRTGRKMDTFCLQQTSAICLQPLLGCTFVCFVDWR